MPDNKYKIAGIGELMWDEFPGGRQLGGAPCNFACHALRAGCDAYLISAVGKDKDGEDILQLLPELGLNIDYIQTANGFPTGKVTVKIDSIGSADYVIHENVAWDQITWDKKLLELAKELDAVCFGSLAQRNLVSRNTVWSFLEATNRDCLKVFDVNLRQSFYNREIILKSLSYANVMKLNDEELPIVASFVDVEGVEVSKLELLMDMFDLQLIAYTKGKKGSILITPNDMSQQEVPEIKVSDTVGAGDSFTAILIAGLLKGLDLRSVHKIATEVAAYVCMHLGATPVTPEKLYDLSNF